MSRKLVSNHISGPRTALNVFFNAHARVTPLASNKVSKSANSPKEILYLIKSICKVSTNILS